MNEAAKKFIMLVEVFFPRQKFNGDEAKEALWLRGMSEILGEYADDVLSEAAATIVRTRDPEKNGTMFPKPKEIISVCDAIRLRKRCEDMPMFSSGDDVRRLAAPQNLPDIKIKRDDVSWKNWINHFEALGMKDVAQAADRLGYIRASSVYPRSTSVVFEPRASGQYQFAQLRQMN